jgi:hypothetical protein
VAKVEWHPEELSLLHCRRASNVSRASSSTPSSDSYELQRTAARAATDNCEPQNMMHGRSARMRSRMAEVGRFLRLARLVQADRIPIADDLGCLSSTSTSEAPVRQPVKSPILAMSSGTSIIYER